MLRYNQCLVDAVDNQQMPERCGTDKIPIRVGTMCAVKRIARRVREESILGGIGKKPSVAAAVVGRGNIMGRDCGTRTTTFACE